MPQWSQKKFVKKLNLSDNSVLLVKKDSWAAQNISEIASWIRKLGVNAVIVVVDDIELTGFFQSHCGMQPGIRPGVLQIAGGTKAVREDGE